MKTVLVYPNNRVCVDGTELSESESLELLARHRIALSRSYPDTHMVVGNVQFKLLYNVTKHKGRKPQRKKLTNH